MTSLNVPLLAHLRFMGFRTDSRIWRLDFFLTALSEAAILVNDFSEFTDLQYMFTNKNCFRM